jgi:hypothetical protein
MNPSIAYNIHHEKWMNIRCVNFDHNYASMDKNGIIETINFICDYDFKHIFKLIDTSSFKKDKNSRILGYEDIRLFFYNGYWCFLANNDELSLYLNSPQMVFGRLSSQPNTSSNEWDIEYVVHLQYAFQDKIEKNWVPLIYDDCQTFEIVYSTHPLIILVPDILTGFCSIKYNIDWDPLHLHFPQSLKIRNSSPYIQYNNGWLGLCHLVYFLKEYNHQRIYYHLFVFFSNDFTKVRYSNIFHLEKHIIEFVTGIINDKDNKQIIISYSLSDSIPKLGYFSYDEIENMLIYFSL